MPLESIKKPYRIFTEAVEPAALDQFTSALRQPFVVRGALMPDAHLGYSLPIGAVVATDGMVLPSWVGYDIGCGMCALPTSFAAHEVRELAPEIFKELYQVIPVGMRHNTSKTPWKEGEALPRSPALDKLFGRNGLLQLGSLGGGNHFIEIGADEQEQVWVIIHSGSRGIGHDLAAHYMRLASGSKKAREGHFAFRDNSAEGMAYIQDLAFCLAFALENRREIMRRVIEVLQSRLKGEVDWSALINRNHNHAEYKDGLWIHRKGATHAEQGMMGVIPGNMRDGSFIVRGKGNPESLWSSSHGAGRVLGRRQARQVIRPHEFAASMKGIVARLTKGTLDEAPQAYKDIFEVMRQQKDMVEIVAHVRPILNIKG
ncbi:MAG: RtcB family protein [Desulfobulbus sp.]|jgi:tRNA-splicing ligase RtcB